MHHCSKQIFQITVIWFYWSSKFAAKRDDEIHSIHSTMMSILPKNIPKKHFFEWQKANWKLVRSVRNQLERPRMDFGNHHRNFWYLRIKFDSFIDLIKVLSSVARGISRQRDIWEIFLKIWLQNGYGFLFWGWVMLENSTWVFTSSYKVTIKNWIRCQLL